MKTLFFTLFVSLACTFPISAWCNDLRYNSGDGKCYLHGMAKEHRKVKLKELIRTHDAECADLSGIVLRDIQGEGAKGWNFKGANFDQVQIVFSYFFESNFSGSNLSNVKGSYISFAGIFDSYTQLPPVPTWSCNTESNQTFRCDF